MVRVKIEDLICLIVHHLQLIHCHYKAATLQRSQTLLLFKVIPYPIQNILENHMNIDY